VTFLTPRGDVATRQSDRILERVRLQSRHVT
jgi:hypothetical protein